MLLPSSKIYSPENLKRVRLLQIGVAVLSGIVCCYLAATTAKNMHDIWSAERLLSKQKIESAALSRQAAKQRELESKMPPPSNGGIDVFALQLAQWAAERDIQVESFVPEGAPQAGAVTADGANLGTWSSSKVRVKGCGDFRQLIDMLNMLRDPGLPAQLESFVLQASSGGKRGAVDFDIVLTIYERKSEAG